jgi:hypothetical protein
MIDKIIHQINNNNNILKLNDKDFTTCNDELNILIKYIKSNNLYKFNEINLNNSNIISTNNLQDLINIAINCKNSLNSFHINNNNLNHLFGPLISQLLIKTSNLKRLDLSYNKLGNVGLSYLSGAYIINISEIITKHDISIIKLEELDLSFNGFDDKALLLFHRGINELSHNIKNINNNNNNISLKILKMNGNNIGNKSITFIVEILKIINLEELYLDNNQIDIDGMSNILQFIGSKDDINNSLKILTMKHCKPNLSVFNIVANSLNNCKLEILDLSFTEEVALDLLLGSLIDYKILSINICRLCDIISKLNRNITISCGELSNSLCKSIKQENISNENYMYLTESLFSIFKIKDNFNLSIDEYNLISCTLSTQQFQHQQQYNFDNYLDLSCHEIEKNEININETSRKFEFQMKQNETKFVNMNENLNQNQIIFSNFSKTRNEHSEHLIILQ